MVASVDCSCGNQVRIHQEATHILQGATLHQCSEGDRTPEDALGRTARAFLMRQRLTPAAPLAVRVELPFFSLCQHWSSTKPIMTLLRVGAEHYLDDRLPNHPGKGTYETAMLRAGPMIQCPMHGIFSTLIGVLFLHDYNSSTSSDWCSGLSAPIKHPPRAVPPAAALFLPIRGIF